MKQERLRTPVERQGVERGDNGSAVPDVVRLDG